MRTDASPSKISEKNNSLSHKHIFRKAVNNQKVKSSKLSVRPLEPNNNSIDLKQAMIQKPLELRHRVISKQGGSKDVAILSIRSYMDEDDEVVAIRSGSLPKNRGRGGDDSRMH